jgi:hypothetical protein
MKKFYLCIMLFYCLGKASAQSWNIQGNSGLTTNSFLGTTDNRDLIFKVNSIERGRLIKNGFWQFGKDTNFLKIDSAGKFSFSGLGDYYVSANRYVFRNNVNPKIGLFYNGTGSKLEFRNKNGNAIFSINANNNNTVLTGTLKIGNYTLPSTDGGTGQVLKTDGLGMLAWANDNGSAYIAGNQIEINGSIIGVQNLKTDAYFNTGIGVSAIYSNTTGGLNVATGYESLKNNTTGSENSAAGYQALNANTTGFSNSAFGAYSLALNTSGAQNTAIGDGSLYSNTTGLANTASGFGALFFNETGTLNTASGNHALQSNTGGDGNVAIGANALFANTTGSNLVAVGAYALYNQGTDNTGTYANTAIGFKSMFYNTTGNNNTSGGYNSLFANTSGNNNCAFGASALYQNTTGINNVANGYSAALANTTGSSNIATGAYTLFVNTSGSGNTATGHEVLSDNTTGGQNTGSGYLALFNNTTGNNNAAFGADALKNNITGNGNTALGTFADVSTSNIVNATAIGYGATVDASNKVRVGSTSVTSIGGQVGWTSFSDGRFKKNIKENVPGLAFINMLKPVTYTVDVTGLNAYYDKNKGHDSSYEKARKEIQLAADEASTIIHNGFVAQDVEKAAATLHYDFSGVDKPQSGDGLYGLRYSDFVVPLVKAVQELSKINKDKDARIDSLQKQYEELRTLVLKIQQVQQQFNPCAGNISNSTQQSTSQQYVDIASKASLEQNAPNPFANTTSINYYLPQSGIGGTSAKIIVTDKNGRTLQQLNLSTPGKGTLHVNTSAMASGSYNYSLYVDGRLIATKQMISVK